MSTKMYNYRINKDQWWPFAIACRRYYLEHYPIMNALKALAQNPDSGLGYRKITQVVDTLADKRGGYTVDLQIFDEGDTLLIRPLEQAWFFMNKRDELAAGFDLVPVTYDNRSDVPSEDKANEAVAKWVDEKIDADEYLVFTVLNHEDFMSFAIDTLITKLT